MGCCNKPRRKFLTKVERAKNIHSLTDVPDDQLTPKQLRVKNRIIRINNRNIRIAGRNKRALRTKARNERKALDN